MINNIVGYGLNFNLDIRKQNRRDSVGSPLNSATDKDVFVKRNKIGSQNIRFKSLREGSLEHLRKEMQNLFDKCFYCSNKENKDMLFNFLSTHIENFDCKPQEMLDFLKIMQSPNSRIEGKCPWWELAAEPTYVGEERSRILLGTALKSIIENKKLGEFLTYQTDHPCISGEKRFFYEKIIQKYSEEFYKDIIMQFEKEYPEEFEKHLGITISIVKTKTDKL